MARTRRRAAWRKSKRWNPTRSQKQAKAWANAHKIGLRGRSSLKRSRRAQKWALTAHMLGRRVKRGRRWNPPISERDLTVMKRVIAVHHRDNVKHGRGGKGKKRNPYYTSPARYAKMSTKARARYRQAQRAARMRRNPGRSSGLCDVMARAGKRWYKVGSRMSKDDAQREKKYQLGAELNGHKVTHVYIRPAR